MASGEFFQNTGALLPPSLFGQQAGTFSCRTFPFAAHAVQRHGEAQIGRCNALFAGYVGHLQPDQVVRQQCLSSQALLRWTMQHVLGVARELGGELR